ncbi:unnamed protein product [Caenorhabditis auriculariae]|uniref:MULE transposase domain-containing protein n=1 Tax=Caenorhabditis auriculariae TaxID=2777116 RepID=A0A8S1HEX5_9PELO|nr:unnamed protein product [Caenorhabditis auriculariae]
MAHPTLKVYNSSRAGRKNGFGKVLELEGAVFHIGRLHKVNEETRYYWQCSFRNPRCNARVITVVSPTGDHVVRKYSDLHCHTVTGTAADVRRTKSVLKSLASSSTKSTSEVIDIVRSTIPASVQAMLPSKASLRRNVQRARKTNHSFPAEPQSLLEIEIPEEFQHIMCRDINGGPDTKSDFVFVDTGVAAGDNRILGFSSESLLDCLRGSQHWMMDGTFQASPKVFYQLFVVHAQWSETNTSVPCFFFLLPNKTELTYNYALSELKSLLGVSPDSVMVDFEKGLHNALEDVFPGVEVSGCLFHLSQSIRKKTGDLGLISQVRNDVELRQLCAMIRSIAFLPVNDVPNGFAYVKAKVENRAPALQPLLDYFENVYIGELTPGNRRCPLFGPEMWNVNQRALLGNPRTNSSVESSHNHLKSFLIVHKPHFLALLKKLHPYLRSIETDLIDLKHAKTLGKVSVTWQKLENKQKAALELYESNKDLPQLITVLATYLSL